MDISILRPVTMACLAGVLVANPAFAEPAPSAEPAAAAEANPDESLAKSLLGQSYSGELEVEGWTNLGGGLVAPPVYVNLYQREADGMSLVVTSKLANQNYVVMDALIITKPWKGYVISTSCMKGEDFTLRFVAESRGPEDQEWWTEVRRAWEIAVPAEPAPLPEGEPESEAAPEAVAEPEPAPGKITKADPKGVKCTSPTW